MPDKPKRKYTLYPAKKWAKVKADWETGKYTTQEISDRQGIPISTINAKIYRKCWKKGEMIKRVEGSVAERNKEYFIRAGVSTQKAIDLIAEGMTVPEMIKFEGKGENMLATPVPDYKVRLEFLKEYNKMTGRYAPMEKDGDKHVHFHVSESQLKEMSASDAISAYQQLQDNDI